MPTRETAVQRGTRQGRRLLLRTGEELRDARVAAGLSSRHVGAAVGISHTQVLRIERALAPHVDITVLARFAAVVGHDLAMTVHPSGPPLRDAAHLALLERLRTRLPPSLTWRTEVPMPKPGDPRSADATIRGPGVDVMVEAETRVGDAQALDRRIAAKQRDLGARRVVLLLADTRHHRRLLRDLAWLRQRFPLDTRLVLAALARGENPAADGLVIL
jgi:transcriptional regulator with XRE-family HTH domain